MKSIDATLTRQVLIIFFRAEFNFFKGDAIEYETQLRRPEAELIIPLSLLGGDMFVIVNPASSPDTQVVGHAQTAHQGHEEDHEHQDNFPHGRVTDVVFLRL